MHEASTYVMQVLRSPHLHELAGLPVADCLCGHRAVGADLLAAPLTLGFNIFSSRLTSKGIADGIHR
jgi:hypothetical protein